MIMIKCMVMFKQQMNRVTLATKPDEIDCIWEIVPWAAMICITQMSVLVIKETFYSSPWKRMLRVLIISTHNICFLWRNNENIPKLPSNTLLTCSTAGRPAAQIKRLRIPINSDDLKSEGFVMFCTQFYIFVKQELIHHLQRTLVPIKLTCTIRQNDRKINSLRQYCMKQKFILFTFTPLQSIRWTAIWNATTKQQQNMRRLMTNEQNGMCAQRRLRSAWAFAQSDQSLRFPHEETLGP